MNAEGITFSGMHKLTTLDYPGVVSAIVFTQGCNFHCPYCHNPQLIPQPGSSVAVSSAEIAYDEVLCFLKKRAGLLDGLVISGGEPTLQPGLALFCRKVRDMGYVVKVDTNGSRPDVLRNLLQNDLINYVAMDCKACPGEYYPCLCADSHIAEAITESAGLLKSFGVAHEFRTTCVTPFVSADRAEELAVLVGKGSPWYLQRANLTVAMKEKGLKAMDKEAIQALFDAVVNLGGDVLHRTG